MSGTRFTDARNVPLSKPLEALLGEAVSVNSTAYPILVSFSFISSDSWEISAEERKRSGASGKQDRVCDVIFCRELRNQVRGGSPSC